jgi:1-acyl-sn-glycerol-3-phosphate acyltransferase
MVPALEDGSPPRVVRGSDPGGGWAVAAILAVRSVLAGGWLFLSLLVLIPLAALGGLIGRSRRVYDWCSRIWARGILLIMGMRVVGRGAEHVVAGEHYVLTANHQGSLDIPALIVALPAHAPLRFVAKRSLFFIPLLGWGMSLFGHVSIDRRGAREAMPGLLRAREDVQKRWSVVFFPEGTRTHTGAMGPFKKGAFHVAAGAGVRVLPVTVIGSWEKLPRQRLFALACGTIQIVIHPPLAPPGVAPDQIQTAADSCRRCIEAELSHGTTA